VRPISGIFFLAPNCSHVCTFTAVVSFSFGAPDTEKMLQDDVYVDGSLPAQTHVP